MGIGYEKSRSLLPFNGENVTDKKVQFIIQLHLQMISL